MKEAVVRPRVSTLKLSPLGWRGVLRDAHGNIIWSCDHSHASQRADSEDSAVCCACEELRRRIAAE